jgi:hypothetical protein
MKNTIDAKSIKKKGAVGKQFILRPICLFGIGQHSEKRMTRHNVAALDAFRSQFLIVLPDDRS